MIVRRNGLSQLLITQPDHAALAGHVIREWRADGFADSARRDLILLAVDQHDNGWLEVDAAPIRDPGTGRVLDFIHAPDDVRQAIWPRGVERLRMQPYAAALVAHHAVHVYNHYRGNPLWRAFFDAMERSRDRHLRAAAVELEQMLYDYRFVRLGDLISLAFCTGLDIHGRHGGYAVRLDGPRVIVTPDPFDGTTVSLEVRAREMLDRAFATDAEADAALASARLLTVTGTVVGSPD
jgi:Protein of unknown function (DUF3891)